MPRLVTIDRAHRLLKTLVWSVGEMAYTRADGSGVWQVYGHRGDHKNIA